MHHVMLDVKDKELLYYLDEDCRQSANQLGRRLRLHRNVVLYRKKRLEESGVIKGYFTEIDVQKLGYTMYRCFINLENYSLEEKEELIHTLKKHKSIIWLFETEGKYDIDAIFAIKTVQEIGHIISDLRIKYNHILAGIRLDILEQMQHYPKDYLIKRKRVPVIKQFDPRPVDLDESDFNILRTIADDATIPITTLAKEAKLSINTVKDKIRRLERSKVILGFRPFIDTHLSGYTYYKIHVNLKNYTKVDYQRIHELFAQNNATTYLTKYVNGDDIDAEMHFADNESFHAFKQEFLQKEGRRIREFHTILFTKEHVYKYFPDKPK
jgi:Lrp/AsnC family leucine-responsive transcriptional regulator